MLMVDVRVEDDFLREADPYRRELLAHCYRMLGSVHDAEDLVQETYLRAWRGYEKFEGRSSLRTWLYRIATTACLTALEGRQRRPMPTGLGAPDNDPDGTLAENSEVPWLEPYPSGTTLSPGSASPDGAGGGDPASVVTSRESIRLAFIVALQHLPPRQRAVLVLRDVLRFRAAEVAEAVGTTTAAVNSLLQRARATLDEVGPIQDELVEPAAPEQKELLDRYVEAFESYDVQAIVSLFTADAVWEMPPFLSWFKGAENIGRLVLSQCPAEKAGDLLHLSTTANGQPALAAYLRDADGDYHAFQLQVLTVAGDRVSHVASFFDVSLFPVFGLPPSLPGASASAP
jgi:RNA polymerase sigma-70 factor (ECF subfamily)